MCYLAELGAVLVSVLTIAGVFAKLVSWGLERSIDRQFIKWSNSTDGEQHWFAKNDEWYRERGHDEPPPPPLPKGRRR